jgi:hypothetical protein
MRAVKGSLGHSLNRDMVNRKALARDKAHLGALRAGWVEYCEQLGLSQPPLSKGSKWSLAAALLGTRRVSARQGWAGEKSGLFEHPGGAFSCCATRKDHRCSRVPA